MLYSIGNVHVKATYTLVSTTPRTLQCPTGTEELGDECAVFVDREAHQAPIRMQDNVKLLHAGDMEMHNIPLNEVQLLVQASAIRDVDTV